MGQDEQADPAQEDLREFVETIEKGTVPTKIDPTMLDTFESRATPADELALALRDLARDCHEFVDAGQYFYAENVDKRSVY
jgi:hypothetical protein